MISIHVEKDLSIYSLHYALVQEYYMSEWFSR